MRDRTVSIITILESMEPDTPMTPRMLIEAVRKAEAESKAAMQGDPLASVFGLLKGKKP